MNNLSLYGGQVTQTRGTLTPIGNTTRNHPDNEEFDSTIADYLEVIDQIERELIQNTNQWN